jgi:DNA-binding GntR family transcriptional regulator
MNMNDLLAPAKEAEMDVSTERERAAHGIERPTPLTKGDYAYTELRRRIISGDLPPGARLDLQELCETLGVSRMPVREALSRLDEQGLVEIKPQLATVVSTLSTSDLRDTYGARIALETLLAGAASAWLDNELLAEMGRDVDQQRELAEAGDLEGYLRSDRRFHDRLYERAGMPRTHGLVTRLRDVADRYVYLFLKAASHRWQSIDEHEQLVRLCMRGDVPELQQAIGGHIARGRDSLLIHLERAELADEAGRTPGS